MTTSSPFAASSISNSPVPPIVPQSLALPGYLLRSLNQSEAPLLHQAVIESVETVGRWMAWCHLGYSLDEALGWIKRAEDSWSSQTAFEFGIFTEHDGQLVGVCGLNCVVWPNRTANLGYWIRQSAQGCGIASAAVDRLASFGFDQLRLTRIEIVAAESNVGSRRVAERCGALLEAICRNRLIVNGVPVPGALYSLIPAS